MAMNRVQFQAGLSLPTFFKRYGSEGQCEQALEAAHWPQGFVYPQCTGYFTLPLRAQGRGLLAVLGLSSPDQRAVGELKSMRTHPDYLRQGAAAAVLDRIIGVARTRGLSRLSLETGSGPAFEPALSLYRKRGFANGPAFGDYTASDFNQFLHLDLFS